MQRFIFALIGCVLLAAAAAWALLVYIAPTDPQTGKNLWIEAYQSWARASVFTAFVTLGSFLLTLKTAIIQRLKEGFDSDANILNYLADREKEKRRDGGHELFYASLQRIGWGLGISVIAALTSSACQMTLGFVTDPVAVAFCMALPAVTLVCVGCLTWNIIKAHDGWYMAIEAKMQLQLKEQLAAIEERRRTRDR